MQKELLQLFEQHKISHPERLIDNIFVGIFEEDLVICCADTWRIWDTFRLTKEATFAFDEYRLKHNIHCCEREK